MVRCRFDCVYRMRGTGNEITDVLTEFSKLIDPRNGRALMERTILIANTSNMPVSGAGGEYLHGITLAEYFRDQGYHVAVMRIRLRAGRSPAGVVGSYGRDAAEEGFPAYLPTKIAEFYERAGAWRRCRGKRLGNDYWGGLTARGDFSEPVTQHTKRFIGVSGPWTGIWPTPVIIRRFPGWIVTANISMIWWCGGSSTSTPMQADRTEIMGLLYKRYGSSRW